MPSSGVNKGRAPRMERECSTKLPMHLSPAPEAYKYCYI